MKEVPLREIDRIRAAYASRSAVYDPLAPWVYMTRQERERKLIELIRVAGLEPLRQKRLIELGAGSGANLVECIRLGFAPENLVGNELLEERLAQARKILPSGVRLIGGEASQLELEPETFDVVYQSMMCTSILDESLLGAVARRMWSLAKPGGGVLWYDFVYDNPKNPSVRGLPVRRVKELFPDADIVMWRLTLAPPVSRIVSQLSPMLYTVLSAIPFLRTHILCWLRKPALGADSIPGPAKLARKEKGKGYTEPEHWGRGETFEENWAKRAGTSWR